MTDKSPKLKLTVRVRRGFNSVLTLLKNANDPTTPPMPTVLAKMKADENKNLEMAVAWLTQNKDEIA